MFRRALAWLAGADMEGQPRGPEGRPPYPIVFPSDWVCFWDVGFLLAEAQKGIDRSDTPDESDDQ